MNPEDRLRSALDARAGAARTSPDALDGVFGKVARRKRNVRLAAATGTALSIVAVSAVAMASLRVDSGGRDVVAASPSVSTSAVVTTPTSVPTMVPPAPVHRVLVVLADGSVVEIDAATGTVLADVTHVKEPSHKVLAYSRARRAVVVSGTGCELDEIATTTGARQHVGTGYTAAYSPDGRYLATAPCLNDPEEQRSPVAVRDLTTGRTTTYWPEKRPANWPEGTFHHDTTVAVHGLHWQDDDSLLITRSYETVEDTIRLEVGKDTSLVRRPVVTGGVDGLFTRAGKVYGIYNCCYPEWEDPTKVVRVRTRDRFDTVFTLPEGTGGIHLERATGALLYTTSAGLWRWDGWEAATGWDSRVGARRLILRDKVTAVLT